MKRPRLEEKILILDIFDKGGNEIQTWIQHWEVEEAPRFYFYMVHSVLGQLCELEIPRDEYEEIKKKREPKEQEGVSTEELEKIESILEENKRLKKHIEVNRKIIEYLNQTTKPFVWWEDDLDDETINRFYKKYIFIKTKSQNIPTLQEFFRNSSGIRGLKYEWSE